MSYYQPKEMVQVTIDKGVQKARSSFLTLAVLGFIAGMFIAVAGLAMIRTMATIPAEWGGFKNLLGACVFPFGLICLLLAGGELVTGNMMAVSMALYAKQIKVKEWARNIAIVTLFNLLGSLFVAYFLGYLGNTMTGVFGEAAIQVAAAKTNETMVASFFSGVGCNILVSTAVYLNFGAKDFIGKIFGIFLPIMGFVIAGFQHVVANMFYIPMAIILGGNTWANFGQNMVSVFLGNLVGGAFFIGGLYFIAYHTKKD